MALALLLFFFFLRGWQLLPPSGYEDNSATSIASKFIHTSTNKMRCPINVVCWTPEGRRLITGASSGEFTLWNGLTFNFETILQAHDSAVRAMVWSHNEAWMVTADHGGTVKYWQSNMNNLKKIQAHKEAVRDLAFAPSDLKFATCSDDVRNSSARLIFFPLSVSVSVISLRICTCKILLTLFPSRSLRVPVVLCSCFRGSRQVSVKIWDFARGEEERTLSGHGWDVKSVAWHPWLPLLVSGSKDNLVKAWDARSGRLVTTLHAHKNTVLRVRFNRNGHQVASASRDQLVKVFDLRQPRRELATFRGHRREATALAWHPVHEDLLVSGGFDGQVLFWRLSQPGEDSAGEIVQAHDASVWDLAWHPLGHILCSGSNDHTTKFWCRQRPADHMRDKYNVPLHQQIPVAQAPAAPVPVPAPAPAATSAPSGAAPAVPLQSPGISVPAAPPMPAPGPFAPASGFSLPPESIPGLPPGFALPSSAPPPIFPFSPAQQSIQQPPPPPPPPILGPDPGQPQHYASPHYQSAPSRPPYPPQAPQTQPPQQPPPFISQPPYSQHQPMPPAQQDMQPSHYRR